MVDCSEHIHVLGKSDGRGLFVVLVSILVIVSLAMICVQDDSNGDVGDKWIEGGIRYKVTSVDSNSVSVISKSEKYEGDLTIPETVTHASVTYNVTTIGEGAFQKCTNLAEVVIPTNVTIIENDAFDGCTHLSDVNIPANVTAIGEYAFKDCTSLSDITIPSNVTTIGRHAFSCCSSLTTLNLPNSVTTIGEQAFYGCASLKNIEVEEGNPEYSSEGGVLFNKEKTTLIQCPGGKTGTYEMPNSVTSISSRAFDECESVTSITMPNGVTSIGDSAFSYCTSLTDMNIPAGVTSLSDYMFYRCYSLTTVSLNDNLTAIGKHAFQDCISLTGVEMPDDMTAIGEYAFYGCISLTGLDIPVNVTSIEKYTFYGCASITDIDIHNNITTIGDYAFQNCIKLANVNMSANLTSIGYEAFMGCISLQKMNIPASVTSIDEYVFFGCTSLTYINVNANNPNYSSDNGMLLDRNKTKLIQCPMGKEGSVVIPDGVTTIDKYAFFGCSSLANVTIPDGVTSIGYSTFCGCTSFIKVTLPSSMTSIGSKAFSECTSLTAVYVECATPPDISDSTFANCADTLKIYVPDGSIESYSSAWKGAIPAGSLTTNVVNPPTAITGLIYNGHEQTGVMEAANLEYIIVENVEIDAGNYIAKITLMPGSNLVWSDDHSRRQIEIAWSIGQKEIRVHGITAQNKTYDGNTDATLVYDNVVLDGMVDIDKGKLGVTAKGTFMEPSKGMGKIVNITDITLNGTAAGNYILANEGQQTMTRANITSDGISIVTVVSLVIMCLSIALLTCVIVRKE